MKLYQNNIKEDLKDQLDKTKNKIPIKKGCVNSHCFCTGACQEVVGYRDKHPQEYLQVEIINGTSPHESDTNKDFKELANGKSSEDCTLDERINVYRASKKEDESWEERKERINRFRCGW